MCLSIPRVCVWPHEDNHVFPEPQPLPHLLREDPRPPLLHGGPLARGYAHLDGRDRHRGGGLHPVPELMSPT